MYSIPYKKEESRSWPSIFFFIKWHHAVGLGNCFFVFFIFSAISCRTRHFCGRVRVLDIYRYLQQFFSYNVSTWIFCVRIRILGTKCIYRYLKHFFSNSLTTKLLCESQTPSPHGLGQVSGNLNICIGHQHTWKIHLR